ncbi:tumor necrosis factor receptor superfamily member 5-like [Solea senegalensis]|uniref:Tumor necrosis factor receptor superfamily member 5-like n=1 Tax=Solea senegalensis TaxID=28829 RepID=A0AAV6SNV2_SOLSE|nr:tumor necrosis factor receptor superfamily member 5 [Solea senegalensis]KAG7519670.1 tumor necrosis factor receptor superfamily member 5-like [Solea senegalensis]
MHLLIMTGMIMIMGKTAAQSHCDPITQYEKAGQCCRMCSPGTSMSAQSTCLEPQCTECGEKEYQDKYNSERQCHRQPYCDPNKNFQSSTQESKKKRTTCLCELGFHCSSEACLTCVPHTACTPGHWAQSTGNHTHDTVCQKCPEGSFSTSNSWNSVCTKWTE